MSLTNTPRSNRLHIGIYGKRNSGKSSLINAITGHKTALVSDVPGTTTDPVFKTMELHGIGPVVFVDTAGFDDEGTLGGLRIERTRNALLKTDIALVLFNQTPPDIELEWIKEMKARKIPFIPVLNKADQISDIEKVTRTIEEVCQQKPVIVSAATGAGIEQIRMDLIRNLPPDYEARSLTEGLAGPGDTVLLVMPQDIQAPKGRLILPQVQTLRDLLDKECIVISTVPSQLDSTLKALTAPPALIITDSQVFPAVYEKKPVKSKLTSFSILLAAYKGDINYYMESTPALDSLNQHSRILIAEACTHAPLAEDIGREQIPRRLRQKYGETLQVDIVSGDDFPQDLAVYDIIIQCGACMFNRKYVLSRTEQAKAQKVPMTNYGLVLAHLGGILDKVVLPCES